MFELTKKISFSLLLFLVPPKALANQVITTEDITVFEDIQNFYCNTPLGVIGVKSRKDNRFYYSESGRISVNSFAPRLDFIVNTVEDKARCRQFNNLDSDTAEPRLGFIFSQVFNYLDCSSLELSCGSHSVREVGQIRLKGSWRNAKGTPRLRKTADFGPHQQKDLNALLAVFNNPYESLLDYYKDPQVKKLGYRARVHGVVVDDGFWASEAVSSSAETFTRWWVPADCEVSETEHCSHTAFLFKVKTNVDGRVKSPARLNVSPWFTKKLVVWSWSPFNFEDNLLIVTRSSK